MAARVASCVYNINDLPDEVLCGIISFLPIKESIRTSVLSRRWRYLLVLMTNLDFELPYTYEVENLNQFLDFIDRLVLLLNIQSVLKFRVSSFHVIDPQRVCRWICALVLNKIQELDLRFTCKGFDVLPLPESLFSCESLVVLKLNFGIMKYFELKVPARVSLLRLKVLHLRAIRFPSDGSEESLFSSFPVIEDLVFHNCGFERGCVKLNVSNHNLKRLTLEDLRPIEEGEGPVDILINTPSLVFLKCSISRYHTLVLIDVKSLTECVLSYYYPDKDRFVTDVLGVLRGIQNIKTLQINNYILLDLQVSGVSIPLFEKMTCLTIWHWDQSNPISMEYFLARCVVLETLVFKYHAFDSHTTDRYSQLPKSQLAPLLLHLKTIEIHLRSIVHATRIMGVIEFFLNNASVLKEMKICGKQTNSKEEAEIMSKITRFLATSSKCIVLFDTLV